MRTTVSSCGIPRILVRISGEDRKAQSEKIIITNTGEQARFFMNTPSQIPKDNNTLSVRFGTIIGMSSGVGGIKKGDIAILDYMIDMDESYVVTMQGDDKIVSVPCMAKLCTEEIISTSYDEKFIERNVIVQKPGDVEEVSFVFGIVRGKQFIPNDYYIFCEPVEPELQSLILFSSPVKKEETHIRRKVVFAGKKTGIQPGDEVVAVLDSNMSLTIGVRLMEIISVTDILAVIKNEQIKVA